MGPLFQTHSAAAPETRQLRQAAPTPSKRVLPLPRLEPESRRQLVGIDAKFKHGRTSCLNRTAIGIRKSTSALHLFTECPKASCQSDEIRVYEIRGDHATGKTPLLVHTDRTVN